MQNFPLGLFMLMQNFCLLLFTKFQKKPCRIFRARCLDALISFERSTLDFAQNFRRALFSGWEHEIKVYQPRGGFCVAA